MEFHGAFPFLLFIALNDATGAHGQLDHHPQEGRLKPAPQAEPERVEIFLL
ncbi:MAG TPA: hypothetical protein PKE27_03960 [Povalibacter sp.]|uniref:hypothetical protein n=1 Tax=Povalibacter sp. TaxID=1962978 RepID=UPI002CA75845|nr:hypothetical protein [Povalibacter sp.]HMN43697.1 hypothetical protein [Povalibacter sp.]